MSIITNFDVSRLFNNKLISKRSQLIDNLKEIQDQINLRVEVVTYICDLFYEFTQALNFRSMPTTYLFSPLGNYFESVPLSIFIKTVFIEFNISIDINSDGLIPIDQVQEYKHLTLKEFINKVSDLKGIIY